jgi:tetratricopeptide (TPR) repeat protein
LGFFSFRREKLADDELRDKLFEAVAASDTHAVKNLASRHLERVIALFPTWKRLPPAVRSDPFQAKFWAEGVIGVASAVAALGDGSLMAKLQGRPEENILVSWQNAFAAAQAKANAGNYSSAIRVLEQALEDTKGLSGTGVDHLLPKTYGLLGTSYYRAGNKEKARGFTSKAREYCARIGDDEGIEIYTRNLDTIDAVPSDMVIFRDAQGRALTVEELPVATSVLKYEVYGGEPASPEANALHQQGREAGARGNYTDALVLFTKAAEIAPRWPYPLYDRACTHLLMKNFAAALSDYLATADLTPRGFFTTLTAVDTLVRERNGEFPQGLYLAYLMLEPIRDTAQRRHLLQQFIDKYPGFAPGWQKFANLVENESERLKAIDKGLAANPDRETKGMLLLNKALVLQNSANRDMAVRLLNELVADLDSTFATEALAKAMLKLITAD